MIEMLRSKIHRATVTDANLNYTGSITISRTLLTAARIYPYQKVQVVNINTGARLETYVITTEEEGCICLNGAAARLAHPGDLVIIMAYDYVEEKDLPQRPEPAVVHVDAHNRICD